jgi:hypothetical protein
MPQNYVLLETIQLSQSASSVTFDNIPQTGYTDLKVVVSARADANDGGTASWMSTLIRVNSSSTGTHRFVYGDGSNAASSSNGSTIWTYTVGSSATANTFGNFELYLPNYASTTQNKSYSVDAVTENNATLSGIWLHAGHVSSNPAVTSLGFAPNSGNFVVGSTFSIYGIAALNTTPAIAPFASGGNIVANDGTYWYHAFLSSGAFIPAKALSCDILQVAGGGGGAGYGGGGGAGGLLAFTSQALISATNYQVTVGAGGTATAYNAVNTGNGTNSQFASLTASVGGGGGGSSTTNRAGNAGGSGGGSGSHNPGNGTVAGGAASPSGQGNAGGEGTSQTNAWGSGGGGGAGQAGFGTTGKGGNGLSTYSSWGLATTTGQNISGTVWYAGGGSGHGSVTTQTGGNGGGGSGGYNGGETAGTPSTGGGGGAGNGSAVNGGSGIVIVRYPMV